MNGQVIGISGATIRADLADVRVGDRVFVGEARLTGEVVRLDQKGATIQVFEETKGLGIGEPVASAGGPLVVTLGPGLLGGVYDGLQRPLQQLRKQGGDFVQSGQDSFPMDRLARWTFTAVRQPGDQIRTGEPLGWVMEGHVRHQVLSAADGTLREICRGGELGMDDPLAVLADGRTLRLWHAWPVRQPRPRLTRQAPTVPLITGQRCLDFLFPLIKGGVAIVPGGFGTGKTVLEQSIAKFADVDIVVYVGCGERGNEMASLLDEFGELQDLKSGRPLAERTIIVANTSNMPVAARESSIFTAVTMAEYYRDMGLDVLLLADSLSRWAEALREISSALEEMPGEDGFPTYLGSRLANFIERAGVIETLGSGQGSLTMILAVSPPGADFTEPVTQSCLRIAGTLWMLDTHLAHRRHFPAVDWTQSYSLYCSHAASHFTDLHTGWEDVQGRCRGLLQREETLREVAEVVGMEGLQDRDRLLMEMAERIRLEFLCQNSFTEDAFSTPQDTVSRITALVDEYDRALSNLDKGVTLEEALRGAADATV